MALETAPNPLMDFLWARGYTRLYVVPPNVVKTSRGHYRRAKAGTDGSDAYLWAHGLQRAHLALLDQPQKLLQLPRRGERTLQVLDDPVNGLSASRAGFDIGFLEGKREGAAGRERVFGFGGFSLTVLREAEVRIYRKRAWVIVVHNEMTNSMGGDPIFRMVGSKRFLL